MEIPCENCVTLAVCKSFLMSIDDSPMRYIYRRCSLADSFVDGTGGVITAEGYRWYLKSYAIYKYLKDGVLIDKDVYIDRKIMEN